MAMFNSGSSIGRDLAKITKRVADLERVLSKFSEQRIFSYRNLADKAEEFVVIAKRQGKSGPKLPLPPFSLVSIEKEQQAFKVIIAPGWIREILTITQEGGDGIIFHMPKAGKLKLSDDPPPEFTMQAGNYLYCTYKTDKGGNIKAEDPKGDKSKGEGVKVVVQKKEQKTKRYQPVDADGGGGEEGEYWIKIGKLEVKDGKTIWITYQNSDIEHYHDLPTFKNLGDGAGVLKDRDGKKDVYNARRIKGIYGVSEIQEAERVALNLDVVNIGDGEPLVVMGEDEEQLTGSEEPMRVRSIRGLKKEDLSASDGESVADFKPQIRVVTAEKQDGKKGEKGDSIIVKGNGKKGSVTFKDCEGNVVATLAWEDGLWTSSGDSEVIAGCDSEPSCC